MVGFCGIVGDFESMGLQEALVEDECEEICKGLVEEAELVVSLRGRICRLAGETTLQIHLYYISQSIGNSLMA